MQIDKELLSEDKYTGNRLIPIKSYTIVKMMKEVEKIQKQANPILDEMDKLTKDKLEKFTTEIGKHREAIQAIQNDPEYKQAQAEYEVLLKRVELKDDKATVIKNKIQPLVDAELEGQLGEFEKPLHLTMQKGKLYVEVADEVEEFIKAKRKKNAPAKSV
jgi:hypothetical protein